MEKSQENYVYECGLSYFWFDNNGFLVAKFKNVVRTLEKQKAAFELIRNITNNRRVCSLVDMRECSLILFDEKTREYMAQEIPTMFKALAFVAPTVLQKVPVTIFLNTMGEPVPIRMFDSEEQAIEWLKLYE